MDPTPATSPRRGHQMASQVPISDVPLSTVPKRRLSSSSLSGAAKDFEMLPAITAQPSAEAQRMLVRKLQQCRVVFNFENPLEALAAKEAKRETLHEIVHYVVAFGNCLTAEVYQEIRTMVDCNVYRPLHPKINPEGEEYDPEENEIYEEPSWTHLHAVYELLLRVLESPNFSKKLAKNAFTEEFALHLLKMFDSEDARERDYIKMSVHRIYGKFLHLRTYMKDQMGYILMDYCSSLNVPYVPGTPEILEILGSIVNGFAVPLKPGNVEFLTQVLLPLIKMPHFKMYYSQLLYCLLHYLVKEPPLLTRIFRYIFRHWPVQVAKKQVLLLNYVNEMIVTVDMSPLAEAAPMLFAHLAKTLQSPHFLVADRCFALLEHTKLMEYARRHSADVIKIVCPALQSVSRHHWNSQLQSGAYKLHKRFANLNAAAAASCEASASEDAAASNKWRRLWAMEHQANAIPPMATGPTRRSSVTSLVDKRLLSKHGIGQMRPKDKENEENV